MAQPIERRQFLKGAAAAVGATLVSGGPGFALKAFATGGPSVVPAMFYWDGTRFVLSQRLASGDPTLESIEVTLEGFGNRDRLLAIDQIVTIGWGKSKTEYPFMAWTAGSGGAPKIRFTAGVLGGLLLRLHLVDGDVDFPLTTGTGSARKLREGTYAIAFGAIGGFRYEEGSPEGPIVNGVGPKQDEYVTVKIARL